MDGTHRATACRDAALIVGLVLIVYVPSLFTRDPWNPDEPRYIEVAREMVVTGEYLVPHLNGELYPDKPAPIFWAFAAFYRLGFGIQGGRVVALLATMGTLLITCQLGRRLYGREVGLLAALITLTAGVFLYISGYGVLDPPLTFFVVASIYCGMRAFDREGRRPGAWWLGFYGAIALGILTKGPVALATPALVVLVYGLVHRREVRGGGWWHLAGVLLMLAVVAAWLAPACIQGGKEYTNNILFQQTFRRMAESESHHQPWYYYLTYSLVYFFPWSLLLILALVGSVGAARRKHGPGAGLELLWFAAVFIFFSAVSGKRERYLLPIVPAVGLLCARYIWMVARAGAAPSRWHPWFWRITFILLAALGGVLVASGLMPGQWAKAARLAEADLAILREGLTTWVRVAAVAAGVALLATCFQGARQPHGSAGEWRRARTLVCGVVVLALGLQLAVMPVLNRFKSARYFVEESKPYLDEAEEVHLYFSGLSGVYNLFLRREWLPVVPTPQALRKTLATQKRVAIISRTYERPPPKKMLRHTWGRVAVRRRVGSRIMLLITNWKRKDER